MPDCGCTLRTTLSRTRHGALSPCSESLLECHGGDNLEGGRPKAASPLTTAFWYLSCRFRSASFTSPNNITASSQPCTPRTPTSSTTSSLRGYCYANLPWRACLWTLSRTMPATTAETLAFVSRNVTVAPLVLLSVVDHYNRAAKGTRKRVVGVLLGQNDGQVVRVSNSFAVPFEEDNDDPSVWFLDHNYVENMNDMFKKINAREKLIGWYHSGPKLRASDLEINELFKRYTPDPLLVIIDVQPKESGVPTDAYFAVEEIKDVRTSRTISPLPASQVAPLWWRSHANNFLGRHNNRKDLCTHPVHDRGGRGGRDRCRAPASRHQRRRHRDTVHTHHKSTAVTARPAPSATRNPGLPPESSRWSITGEPRGARQPARHFQPPP
ncbi:26S proteasome regulatory subunit N8 [Microdochium nivale]|nr:26S proteasome regulatory subunit N8 [Microdochium nivale]